jgi:hypothetical protein
VSDQNFRLRARLAVIQLELWIFQVSNAILRYESNASVIFEIIVGDEEVKFVCH